jgi:hypothetical protein
MTTERDPRTRTVLSWLREDAHENAERVLLRALDEVDTTPQRRSRWPAWRPSDMNTFAKVLVATAAVVAVAVLGINLRPGSQTGAGGPPPSASPSTPPPSPSPSPSPTPTATPTASPTPSATPKSVQVDGDLQPGRYTTRLPVGDTMTLTFTVPGGWSAFADAGVLHGLLPPEPPGTGAPGGIAFQFRDVTTLKGDPCHWSGTDHDIRVGPTAADLVQALQEQTGYEASKPVDVTVGGYVGKRVDIVSPTELFAEVNGSTTAVGCDDGVWRPWDGEIYAQGPANRWQTNILDVDGTRLVIVVQDFPGTSAADRAVLDAILESMVIKP